MLPSPATALTLAATRPLVEVNKRYWKVLHVDSEQPGEGWAKHAFDGDPDTFWHTNWQTTKEPYPHELAIDLGETLAPGGRRAAAAPGLAKRLDRRLRDRRLARRQDLAAGGRAARCPPRRPGRRSASIVPWWASYLRDHREERGARARTTRRSPRSTCGPWSGSTPSTSSGPRASRDRGSGPTPGPTGCRTGDSTTAVRSAWRRASSSRCGRSTCSPGRSRDRDASFALERRHPGAALGTSGHRRHVGGLPDRRGRRPRGPSPDRAGPGPPRRGRRDRLRRRRYRTPRVPRQRDEREAGQPLDGRGQARPRGAGEEIAGDERQDEPPEDGVLPRAPAAPALREPRPRTAYSVARPGPSRGDGTDLSYALLRDVAVRARRGRHRPRLPSRAARRRDRLRLLRLPRLGSRDRGPPRARVRPRLRLLPHPEPGTAPAHRAAAAARPRGRARRPAPGPDRRAARRAAARPGRREARGGIRTVADDRPRDARSRQQHAHVRGERLGRLEGTRPTASSSRGTCSTGW